MNPLKRLLVTIAQAVDLRDVFVACGLGAIGYGIGQIYPPAAWIVIGAVILILGIRR